MMGRNTLVAVVAGLLALGGATQGATVEFTIDLNGGQAGTNSAATGTGSATLETNTGVLAWTVNFDANALLNGAGSVVAAHFHSGPAGTNGPAVTPPGNVGGAGSSPLAGSAVIERDLQGALMAGAVYFNIHTTGVPAGEIRGQVAPAAVSVEPSKDNTLYEDSAGGRSNGAGRHLFTGRSQDGDRKRALIAFDIAGAGIPAGSTITRAVLTMNMSKSRAGSEPVELRAVLRDWGEAASDAGGNEGSGTAARPGDATWLHAFHDDQRWEHAGGDFAELVSAQTTVFSTGSYSLGPTGQMANDVQIWLDRPERNFGWLLLGNEERTQTSKRFDSREHATVSNRPRLQIDYRPPCPFALAGDVNRDCRVDFQDLATLAAHWLIDCEVLPLDPACTPQ